MKFLVRKEFNGKNLLGHDIHIPCSVYVESDSKFILWEGLPVCIFRSNLANEYFIWADDGFEQTRLTFEDAILFKKRTKIWNETVPIYDDNGNLIKYETVEHVGRYSPEEVNYIRTNFNHLILPGDGFVFNDLFYIGSNIKDIEKIARYLNR